MLTKEKKISLFQLRKQSFLPFCLIYNLLSFYYICACGCYPLLISVMQSDLECPLCHSEYSSDNMPRLLTACGHTYCQSCLDTLFIEEDNQYRLQCPQDNIVVYLKTNDIAQFPKNIALIKLIDIKKHNNSSKEESLEITKIQKQEDSHGNESEQQIINEIVSSGRLEQRNEQKKRKDSSNHSEQGELLECAKGKPSPKIEQELCLVHQKPLQVVCLVDMQKICNKCALFGQHKGHQVKSIEQIEEECKSFHQNIFAIYNEKEDILKQWQSINSKEVLEILEVNRKKIIKEVAEKYKRLRDAVAKSEEDMLAKIDSTCAILEQKIRATLKIDQPIINEYSKFQNQSFGIVIKSQEPGLYEQKLKMLYDNTTDSLLFRGKEIVARIKAQHNNIFSQIQKIINSIKMEYSEEDVFQALKKFSNIKLDESQYEKAETVNERHNDESLLESQLEEQQNVNYSNTPSASSMGVFGSANNIIPVQAYSVTFSEHKGSIAKTQPRIEVKPDLSQKIREPSIFVEQQQPQKIQRPTKKKLKSIKVPQKIEKVLQLLYNDALDTLDLTNAELGDGLILQICQFLRGTRVRTVKFIRNKLSDDAVGKMISSFGGVATLNLSQNYLTEQSLVHLANQRNAMPNLKTVILSQNRIIERKHKEYIERLKRTDLNVST